MDKYTLETQDLIALCHIIDNFDEFNKKIMGIMSKRNNRDFIYNLLKISQGQFCIFCKKEKEFYNENKSIIDIINEHSNIFRFVVLNYDWYGNPHESLIYFYKYISNHKEQLDTILTVIEKIKTLGFCAIGFNPDIDLSQETYKAHTFFSNNYFIKYLDNLEAIPNYDSSVVEYKTNNSPYLMYLQTLYGTNLRPGEGIAITINDLTFSPDRLPNVISKEEIFDKIVNLKKEKKQDYSAVRNSIDLSMGIEDLRSEFNRLCNKIDNLSNIEQKAELIELLNVIREAILKIENISSEYDKYIAANNPNISERFLKEEKCRVRTQKEESKISIW